MTEGPQKSLGEMRAMISREMVLEESFTRAEKTLVERGERE
jgi:hypothetical protein